MAVVDPIADIRNAISKPTIDERVWSRSARVEREAILARGGHTRFVCKGRKSGFGFGVTPSGRLVPLREYENQAAADAGREWLELDVTARRAAIRGIRRMMRGDE